MEALENTPLTKDKIRELASLKYEGETPFGKVLMTYNVDAESFCYYTDSRNVPYKTLDAVARRFAVEHNCRSICVNYKEEWNKAKAAAQAQQEEDMARESAENIIAKTSEDNKPRDVFVKFQSYNTVHKNRPTSNSVIEKPNKKSRDSIKRRKYRPVVDLSLIHI